VTIKGCRCLHTSSGRRPGHRVRDALSAARDHRPDNLVVDLSAITFCSVRGFVELAGDAFAPTGGYTLTGIGPHMERLAALARSDPR
jgi:hypothetical protein